MAQIRPNPQQLAALALAGFALAASAQFLNFLHIPRLGPAGCGFWQVLWTDRLRALAFVAPLAAGLTVALWAERRLEQGYRNEVWTPEELAPALALVSRPPWKLGSLLVLIAFFIFTIFSRPNVSGGASIYLLLLPFWAAMRIRLMLKPPSERKGFLLDLRQFKPIHSGNWGAPRAVSGQTAARMDTP